METIKKWMKICLKEADVAHDYQHAERVANLAKQLYFKATPKTEVNQDDLTIILTAAYVHDCFDDKVIPSPQQNKSELIKILKTLSWSDEQINLLFDIVDHLSFSKQLENPYSLSFLGKIVQDADRLDAIGAIGIARTFAFCGRQNTPIYDPNQALEIEHLSLQEYKVRNRSGIQHFYDKLLNLESTMNTPEGKAMAKHRTQYMKLFLDEFFDEWDGRK